VPDVEGNTTVIEPHPVDEKLRQAFQAIGDTSDALREEELERVWKAVSGDLPAGERQEIVDRMATDPAYAEAWRVAQTLWSVSLGESAAPAASPSRNWVPAWLAVAAVVIVGVGVVLVQVTRTPDSEFREQSQYVIESLVPSDATLPRSMFRLRWAPGPDGSRYVVRVTTEDLRVLATAADLTVPELVIERDLLQGVASGARILWQVDTALPDGARVSSRTFVARVE
jgi:hypothetical protein